MILIMKPIVMRLGDRWWTIAPHTEGTHREHWRTHLSALNCALAIARTSDWRLPEGTPS